MYYFLLKNKKAEPVQTRKITVCCSDPSLRPEHILTFELNMLKKFLSIPSIIVFSPKSYTNLWYLGSEWPLSISKCFLISLVLLGLHNSIPFHLRGRVWGKGWNMLWILLQEQPKAAFQTIPRFSIRINRGCYNTLPSLFGYQLVALESVTNRTLNICTESVVDFFQHIASTGKKEHRSQIRHTYHKS